MDRFGLRDAAVWVASSIGQSQIGFPVCVADAALLSHSVRDMSQNDSITFLRLLSL